MTITLRDEGKRIYFAGNTFPAKDQIKSIGGRWDADAKAWWIAPEKRAEAVALCAESTIAQDRAIAALPALTGKLVPVPGNTYPARTALRDLGGQWDAASKQWLVDASRLTLAQDAVAAASSKVAAPRAPSPVERELREEHERAQVARVAALKRLDEASAALPALMARWDAEGASEALLQEMAARYALEERLKKEASEASAYESLCLERLQIHQKRQMPREPYRYIRGW